MSTAKNISTIGGDQPFLERLAEEIWRRSDGDGFALSKYMIFLPTRRACRALGTSFARLAEGKPVLLPRLRPLGEVDEDEITFSADENFALPPAIAPLRRLMLLTQQVQKRDPSLSGDQAAQAADALARFLDQIEIERCDVSLLPGLVEKQELAQHWQQTLAFLDIVTTYWPKILTDLELLDPAARRNRLTEAQAELWRNKPPTFPVIAAGSTGSIPATADLLSVIAGLPQGEVILPGLDRALDNAAWADIEDTHPQYNMKRLLEKMAVPREAVYDFGGAQSVSPRLKLLSEAMRPASCTEAWRDLRGRLGKEALQGLTQLTLDHPQEEAQVIALRLRALLEEPDKTAAFVTADRALAVRVAALLRRWGIEVDDSGGTPLSMLPLGAFLNLTLAASSPDASATDLLALLKHPFAACGKNPALCRAEIREAELRARHNENEDFAELKKCLSLPLKNRRALLPLAAHIDAHIAAAEAVAASDNETGATRLWQGETGEAAQQWFGEWREAAASFPPLTGADYAALFASLSSVKTMRSAQAMHPRLTILGPLESRLIGADLVILGGLNEGQWPPDAGFDPWMSRPMRKKFGLPSPEFRIGLSAHDFTQLAASREVMLTRALRRDGTPTVPSRFLLQIDAVLRAAGLADGTTDALAPAQPWRQWAHALDAPMPADIKPCPRPQPRPPAASRPRQLSVTDIGDWLRNPYAIYAKYILNLRKLEELDAELDAADRGNMIHKALEKFLRAYPVKLPDDAKQRLLAIGEDIFGREEKNPRVRAFWWARFIDIAQWFVAHEKENRAKGRMPLTPEARGTVAIEGMTLKGRADRIDRLADGALAITDYKTGAFPKKDDMLSGIEPQLQVLALIAAQGGFDKIAACRSGALEYWALKGGSAGCEVKNYVTAEAIPDLIAEAEEGLKKLIRAFADPATPYEAAPKPKLQPRFNDYAHLARLAEWGRTAEDS